MPVENASTTDLGGGALAPEPDIFDGVSDDTPADDSTTESGDLSEDDSSSDGDTASGTDDGSDAEGSEDAGEKDSETGDQDEGAEGEDETTEEPEGEGSDKGASAESKGAKGVKKAPAPQTEEEKEVEKTLTDAYRDFPKLKEVFKTNPELRAPFFKAAQMNKIFPTVREAEQAKDWAMSLFEIDKLYYSKDLSDKKNLQKLLWEENLDRNGQSTGHYEQLQELFTADSLAGLERAITQNPGLANMVQNGFTPEQAKVAVEVVRRLIQASSGRPLSAGGNFGESATRPTKESFSGDTTQMSPRERAMAEELASLRSEKNQRTAEEQTRGEQDFNTKAFSLFWDGDGQTRGLKSEVDKRIPSVYKGNEFFEDAFRAKVLGEIQKQLSQDAFFNSQLDAAARSGDRGPEHIAELADMLRQRAGLLVPTIAREIAQKISTRPRSEQRVTRGRGNERPHREPATGGSPGRLTKPAPKGGANKAAERRTVKNSGDYNRDADAILGIE